MMKDVAKTNRMTPVLVLSMSPGGRRSLGPIAKLQPSPSKIVHTVSIFSGRNNKGNPLARKQPKGRKLSCFATVISDAEMLPPMSPASEFGLLPLKKLSAKLRRSGSQPALDIRAGSNTFKAAADVPISVFTPRASFRPFATLGSPTNNSQRGSSKDLLHPMTIHEQRKYNKNKEVLTKVKTDIGRLMNECTRMERFGAVSKKALNEYGRNIMKRMENIESVSKFFVKDSVDGQGRKIKLRAEGDTAGKLYYKLNKRQEKITKDMDEYFDIIGRFSREESKAYLARRNELGTNNQVARYARESHRKIVVSKRAKTKSPYLMYTDKVMEKLAAQEALSFHSRY